MATKPDALQTFTVGGTVTGLNGGTAVLQLNGADDVTITADGSFSFSTPLEAGASYTVVLPAQPTCPMRRCTLADATGTIAGVDAAVTLTCETPKQRLVSGNWGEKSFRVTDDVLALANNATATPRIVMGPQTQISTSDLDSVAYDHQRDIVYMATGASTGMYGPGIVVFHDASTLTGDVDYSTRITVIDETEFLSLEVDVVADRLYANGRKGLYVFDLASTLSGPSTPSATLTPEDPSTSNAGTIALDRVRDRLYVGGEYTDRLFIYDNARTLASTTMPTRTVSWMTANDDFSGPPAIAIDECRDRLYLGSNDTSPMGFSMFAFDNASTLNGMIDPETASQAQLRTSAMQAISAEIDSDGNLYYWDDSPTKVWINRSPHTWSGPVTVMPDLTINGVVDRGYGLEVVPYY